MSSKEKAINEDGKKGVGYVKVSRDLLSSRKLKPKHKLFLALVLSKIQGGWRYNVSNAKTAHQLGVTERTIQRYVEELNDYDFFNSRRKSKRNKNNPNSYVNGKDISIDQEKLKMFLEAEAIEVDSEEEEVTEDIQPAEEIIQPAPDPVTMNIQSAPVPTNIQPEEEEVTENPVAPVVMEEIIQKDPADQQPEPPKQDEMYITKDQAEKILQEAFLQVMKGFNDVTELKDMTIDDVISKMMEIDNSAHYWLPNFKDRMEIRLQELKAGKVALHSPKKKETLCLTNKFEIDSFFHPYFEEMISLNITTKEDAVKHLQKALSGFILQGDADAYKRYTFLYAQKFIKHIKQPVLS